MDINIVWVNKDEVYVQPINNVVEMKILEPNEEVYSPILIFTEDKDDNVIYPDDFDEYEELYIPVISRDQPIYKVIDDEVVLNIPIDKIKERLLKIL